MSRNKEGFKVLGIDHIGLVPSDNSVLLTLLREGLGFISEETETVSEQKTQVQKLSPDSRSSFLTALELLSPLEGEGPIQKFKDKNKSGIHHIALRVSHLEAAIKHLLSLGVKMIDEIPRIGHNKTKIAFIHPKASSGILLELVEKEDEA